MRLTAWINRLLEHPIKVTLLATALAFTNLLTDGTFFNLWNLKKEKTKLEKRFQEAKRYNEKVQFKIDLARNSDRFIERQAREKLDLLKEDELVFIFETQN